jgi:hypothetical protein
MVFDPQSLELREDAERGSRFRGQPGRACAVEYRSVPPEESTIASTACDARLRRDCDPGARVTSRAVACDAMTGGHSATAPGIAGGAKTAAIMSQSRRLAAAQLQLRPGGATDSSCGRGTTILTTRACAIGPDHGAAAFQAKGS